MRVTVGMPVYNGERFIRETMDAVLGQTYEDFESIIADNASTDGTEAICREYVERDRRVSYLRSSVNHGMAWNHNRLVEVARGSYFKWVGADDLYEPEYLAHCVAALDEDPGAVLASTKTVFIDEAGRRLKEYDPEWALRFEIPYERLRMVIIHGGHLANADALSGVIRTDALRRTRLLPSYQGGDKRPLGELSLLGRFIQLPEYLLLRRLHCGASSMNNPSRSGYDERSCTWMVEFFKGSIWQITLPSWSLAFDHLITTWCSHLAFKEKLKLTGVLVKVCRWHQRYLFEELRGAMRLLLRAARWV